jgi:hypothetical protein
MEPEGSLPQSQVPATCPYPEPVRSSQYPHIPLPEDPLKFINKDNLGRNISDEKLNFSPSIIASDVFIYGVRSNHTSR